MSVKFLLDDVSYEHLSENCPRGDFYCSEPQINKWFLKDALRRHESFTCRVTTAHLNGNSRPIGFYALGLILESDRFLKGTGPIRNRAVQGVYPALHLEYIAVDKDYVGHKLGTEMLGQALLKFTDAVIQFGVPVMTLAPLDDKIMKFYSARGFVRFAAHVQERRMMLTAHAAMNAYNVSQTRPAMGAAVRRSDAGGAGLPGR